MRVRLPLVAAGAGHKVECALARFEVAAILDGPAVQAFETLSARARPVRARLAPGNSKR